MKPLIVLLVTFFITLLALYLVHQQFAVGLAGRVAMSVMLLFTTVGHFLYTKGMAMMVPGVIPYKQEVVYITGIIELAAAIGLQIAVTRQITAWLLILFFILMLPANVYAALNHIDYQKGTRDGAGVGYLWFRVPLQIVFIIWTYYFCLRS